MSIELSYTVHELKFKHPFFLLCSLSLTAIPAFSQGNETKLPPEATEVWEPEPRIVTPGSSNHLPPSDAIVSGKV